MIDIKTQNKKNVSLSRALQEIDIIYSVTVRKLEKLHQQKMKLIKYYGETGRQAEITKIRKSLKDI